MLKRWWPPVVVGTLLVVFLGAFWHLNGGIPTTAPRVEPHPAQWPSYQGGMAGRFATPANFPEEPPAVLWTYRMPSAIGYPPVIGVDGTIYISTMEEIIALSADGAQIRWAWKSNGFPQFITLGRGGEVYILEREALVSVDSAGRLAWRTPLPADGERLQPIVGYTGLIYVRSRGELHAIAPDGNVAWSIDWPGPYVSPVESSNGQLIIAQKGELEALNADGSTVWKTPVKSTDRANALAAAPDGTIYYRAETSLYILDSKGKVKAEIPAEATRGWTLAFSGDILQDGFTRRQPDGSLLWAMDPANLKGLYTYLDAAGNVLVLEHAQSPEMRLSLRDAQGAERWRLRDWEIFSLPAIGADGRICLKARQRSDVTVGFTCFGAAK